MISANFISRRLKLRDLHMLEAVSAAGSMARAAERLAISQPTISKAIADLEHDLGLALFERSSRGVELTPSGHILLRRGRAMLDELKQGLQEIESLSDPTVGEVRIGAVDAWSPYISTIVEQTSRRYPKITYKVVFGDSDMFVAALRNRTLDVVITRAVLVRSQPDLDAEVLFHDRIAVVTSATHPLARRRKIALRDLLDERWVIGPPDSFLYQLMMEAFQAKGLAMPNAMVTTLSIQLRLDLLQSGHFVTADTSSMMDHPGRKGRIKALPIDLGDIAGPMAAVTLKARQPSGPLKLVLNEARAIGKSITVLKEKSR
jgi:DNA-binding transcriptional LysR family regulator